MAATSHGIQVVERERVPAPPPGSGRAAPETATTPATSGPRAVPAAGLGAMGLLTLLVGAWGGIVPFVGPLFGYSADGSTAWYWNMPHALLWLAPGAAAVVAGAAMLGALPRALKGLGRPEAFGAGLLAVLAGAWFVIGPEAWPVLERTAGVFSPGSPMHEFSRQIGYSFGPGVVLLVLGAMAMAMSARRTRAVRVEQPVVGRPPATGSRAPATA